MIRFVHEFSCLLCEINFFPLILAEAQWWLLPNFCLGKRGHQVGCARRSLRPECVSHLSIFSRDFNLLRQWTVSHFVDTPSSFSSTLFFSFLTFLFFLRFLFSFPLIFPFFPSFLHSKSDFLGPTLSKKQTLYLVYCWESWWRRHRNRWIQKWQPYKSQRHRV